MIVIVLLGAPGSGKGTQGARLAQQLGLPEISTGEIFRRNIAERTELGELAHSYISRGHLVPDDVTNELVRDRLHQPDVASGFLLDGYPRTVAQAQALDTILEDLAPDVVIALELTVDTDTVVSRLLKRAELEGREDDTEDVIRNRMQIYFEQTAPVSGSYAKRGALVQVDGMGSVDEVASRVREAMAGRIESSSDALADDDPERL